jgi:hypothetical protein
MEVPRALPVGLHFTERSRLFNEKPAFSCPDSCERYGCKEPNCSPVRREQASSRPFLQITLVVSG